jgi:uncharacterized protein YlxW (UPF0749 family)
LSYAHFVVPLVKAVQQLNDQNKALQQKVDDQQKEINDLKAQQQKMGELEQQVKAIAAKLAGK